MRVVLDANVLVSAAIAGGPPHRIVQAWLYDAAYEVIICPEILAEVTMVLTERPRLRRWISTATAENFIETFRAAADLVEDPEEVQAVTRDRDDDYLISLARSHRVDFIVSGDRDLLEWEDQSPPVVTPAAFEALIDLSTT